MREFDVGFGFGWLSDGTTSRNWFFLLGRASSLAFALELDANLFSVFFMRVGTVCAIATIVTVVLSDFLIDGIHNHAGDWGVNLGKHIASGIKSVSGSTAVLGDDEYFVNESGHNDRVSDAVAWSAIEDDDIEVHLEGVDELFILFGAEELGWVWWIGATSNDIEIVDRSSLDVVAEVGNFIDKEMT